MRPKRAIARFVGRRIPAKPRPEPIDDVKDKVIAALVAEVRSLACDVEAEFSNGASDRAEDFLQSLLGRDYEPPAKPCPHLA